MRVSIWFACAVLLATVATPTSSATAPCGKTEADANRDAGICASALCMADSVYPVDCIRAADTYHFMTCPAAGSSTVSSKDPDCCCAEMCRMEYPNSTECLPTGSCRDFECCARNGNPIMESYPEQCTDPISGNTFTKCYPELESVGDPCVIISDEKDVSTEDDPPPSAPASCGKTEADANHDAGRCASALCMADSIYPADCIPAAGQVVKR